VNARRDGSSRFGPGKQFGNFGSAGMAWIFSDEPAIKKAMPAFFSFGKLRLSYGITGSDAIGNYQYLSLFSVRGTLGNFNPPYTVLQPDRLFNPDFAWETNRKADVELTLGFLNDRITATANYYNNRSGNQLTGRPLPRMTGFANVNGNLNATVQNSGLELQLNTEIVKSRDFSWNSNFNFTIPRNKLVSYPDLENSTNRRVLVIGQPISIRRVYDHAGVNPQTGVNVYRTFDGKDTSVMSGSGLGLVNQHLTMDLTPKYYGGWNNNFRYKGWSLSVMMRYDYRTRTDGFTGTPGFDVNIPQYVYNNSWRRPGDAALFQKFTQNVNSPAYLARAHSSVDAYYKDTWYVSLNNLSLSYALPGSLLKKLHFSSCRFYVNAQNLFVLSNFNGADATTLGANSMPRLRVVTAGVHLNL
jgi:TonB-dependent starch-binding outer membrane protein SusC